MTYIDERTRIKGWMMDGKTGFASHVLSPFSHSLAFSYSACGGFQTLLKGQNMLESQYVILFLHLFMYLRKGHLSS